MAAQKGRTHRGATAEHARARLGRLDDMTSRCDETADIGHAMFPGNARALLLPPSGRGVLLGDDKYTLPVVGKPRHRAAIDKLSSGRKFRSAALLTRAGRDYDRYGVMVTIRGQEVGFLPWIDGRDFRKRLREAGFLEAVCKAEITGDHVIGDSWDYVGLAIDALLPFTFVSPEEWRNQHTAPHEREPMARSSHSKVMTVIDGLGQSFLKASSRYKPAVKRWLERHNGSAGTSSR
jgi:hypothetical protein